MKAIQDYYREQEREPTRRRAGDDRADVERALRPQDAQERGGRRGERRGRQDGRHAALREPDQGHDLREHDGADRRVDGHGAVLPLASSRTTPASSRSTTSTRCASRSRRTTTPAPSNPTAAAPPASAACIRDVLGTGLAAKPIANTDVFCVAYPAVRTAAGDRYDPPAPLPKGVIHPRRILQQVVAGVRDYGNRMGIPTVNGGRLLRRPLRRQPAGLLRLRRAHPARQDREGRRARRRDRRHGRPHGPRRHPRGDVLLRRADRHARRRVFATPCRSATRSPRRRWPT